MTIHSRFQPAGDAPPAGLLRAASRWVVQHPRLTALLVVSLASALCVGQWWLAYQRARDWDAGHPGQPIPFRLFGAVGWTLTIGAGAWFGLLIFSGRESNTPSGSSETDWWRFDARERQQIFEGRLLSQKSLCLHALFGLIGFVLGVGLMLRIAAAAGWQVELLSGNEGPLGLVVLAILVTAFAARRVRDVLFLWDFDYFAGGRAQELAQAIAEERQAEAEAEREYERKTITGWPYLIFIGGLVGGVFLAARWLPEADGIAAGQGSVSGLIASVAAVYLLKLRPRAWRIWLGLAVAVALGFLVFTQQVWHRPVQYALLGVLWGAAVGATATLLYLRKLRGN